MREQVAAILEEVRRLKRGGVTALPVSDEALAMLRKAVDAVDPLEAGAEDPGATYRTDSPTPPVVEERFAGSTGRAAADGFRNIFASLDREPNDMKKRSSAKPKPAESDAPGGLPPPPDFEVPAGSKRERWEWLRDRVVNCPVCQAHTHGECKVVFGVGNIDADIFFCGEAPGGDEEEQGEPFVGRAGQLLNKMISAMALTREKVYIGNILNWRPEMEGRRSGSQIRQTGNRPPTQAEMRFGLPYLRAQVEVVQPKVIVALGSTAAEGLLGFGSFKALGEVRGRWHTFNGIPLMITYHPSYLLRNASNRTKRIVWEDLMLVMEKVGLEITDKQRGFFL